MFSPARAPQSVLPKNWRGARKVADMMALIGHRVAQADAMPAFDAGTEYARRARGEAPAEGRN
jgi:hypothetical protein